ncbi:MAG TPA: hypothetical protein VM367_08550 [Pseudonocardia sp.]|nr:hypothetical protein [Pseudonocardia sp.]
MKPNAPRATLGAATLAATAVLTAACGTSQPAPPPPAAAPPAAGSNAPAPQSAQQSASPGGGNRPAPVGDPGAEVDADDQTGDGASAVIREARVSAGPGWVAVLTDDDGVLLGSAPVEPGVSGPVTVPLTEPPPAGDDELTAALYLDDGDGVFDPATDPRVLDDDGDGDDVEDDDFDYRTG